MYSDFSLSEHLLEIIKNSKSTANTLTLLSCQLSDCSPLQHKTPIGCHKVKYFMSNLTFTMS